MHLTETSKAVCFPSPASFMWDPTSRTKTVAICQNGFPNHNVRNGITLTKEDESPYLGKSTGANIPYSTPFFERG